MFSVVAFSGCLADHVTFLVLLGDEDGYSYLPYGNGDKSFRGDDVTGVVLSSPTKIFVGDGSEGEFYDVIVSCELSM